MMNDRIHTSYVRFDIGIGERFDGAYTKKLKAVFVKHSAT